MELKIEIQLSDETAGVREELLKSLESELRKVDPTSSVSALNAFSGVVDPNLLSLIVHIVGSLDPGSVAAAAAGVGIGIAPKVVRRAITSLAAFAKKFGRPLPVKVGDISFELPPDTPASEIGKIVGQIAGKRPRASPSPSSRTGKSTRNSKRKR
jgi:hypothetical protein